MIRKCILLALLAHVGLSAARRHFSASARGGRPSSSLFLLVRSYSPTFCEHQRVSGRHCSRPSFPAFTLHGLWPEYSSGSWPQFCDGAFGVCSSCHGCRKPGSNDGELEGWDGPTSADDGAAEEASSSLTRHEPAALGQEGDERQQCEWPSFGGKDAVFWDHEWERHGTCAGTIASDRPAFVEATLLLHEQYDLQAALEKAGIAPSDTHSYSPDQLRSAIKAATGATPLLVCFKDFRRGKWLLEEVRICVGKDLHAFDCPPGVVADHDCEVHAECGDEVMLLTGDSSAPSQCSDFFPAWGPGSSDNTVVRMGTEGGEAGGMDGQLEEK